MQRAAASWASLDKLGGKPYREAKSSITTLTLCLCLRFLLQLSLSPLHHWPELSQPCGQNQSLSLPGVRHVWSPLRPFLKHSQCQGAELCPTQVVGPTGMYSPVLHPHSEGQSYPSGHNSTICSQPLPASYISPQRVIFSLLRNQREAFAATALGTQHGGERVAGMKKSYPIFTGKKPLTKQRVFHLVSPLDIYSPMLPSPRHSYPLTSQLTCPCNSTGYWWEATWEEPGQH